MKHSGTWPFLSLQYQEAKRELCLFFPQNIMELLELLGDGPRTSVKFFSPTSYVNTQIQYVSLIPFIRAFNTAVVAKECALVKLLLTLIGLKCEP